jgi:ubiquinol-cytochrome c reductase cytochrome b subunit
MGLVCFFFFLFLHFFKGLFFCSYRLLFVWSSGLLLFLFIMAEAFMGYVLVWAQMRFWASVVITSLLSVIPFFGPVLVNWVWGGFSVSGATLKFFFVLHFLLPWLLLVVVLLHLLFLHETGSSSKLFCHGDYDKIAFFRFYWWKDGVNLLFFFFFVFFVFFFPYRLGDPEIFIEADPMISPVHIVPEWYFLFAYAILRAIPNKVLGVFFLLLSIVSFFFFFFLFLMYLFLGYLIRFLFFFFFFVGIVLSWLGQCVVEPPFLFLSGLFSFFYFFFLYFYFFFFFLVFLFFCFVFIIIKIYWV